MKRLLLMMSFLAAFLIVSLVPSRSLPSKNLPASPFRVPKLASANFIFTSYPYQIYLQPADSGVTRDDVDVVKGLLARDSIPVLSTTLTRVVPSRLYIRLYSNATSYSETIQKYYPQSIIQTVEMNSWGFAHNNDVFIPLYRYKKKDGQFYQPDLANFLTHELTHATLTILQIHIPTWMNEGFAWYNGLAAEKRVNPEITSVLSNGNFHTMDYAEHQQVLLPLTHTETQIFQENAYNVEWEDYAAVEELINDYGLARFREFLFLTPHHSAAVAFSQAFPGTLANYEQFFYTYNR